MDLSVRGEQPDDRNFAELLQEQGLTQTAVQILFALLLSVSFTGAFAEADSFQRTVYVITLVCAVVATGSLTAAVGLPPEAVPARPQGAGVQVMHGLLQAGPVMLLLAMVGVLLLVVDQAVGRLSGLLVSSLLVGIVYALLCVVPAGSRGDP